MTNRNRLNPTCIDRARRAMTVGLAAVAAMLTGVSALATVTASQGGTPQVGVRDKLQQARPASVTLITGDRVLLDSAGRVKSIEPAAGRRNILFTTSVRQGEVTVMPSDAVPLLQRGVVDPRLFNVSLLVRSGYDDAQQPTLPTIARGIDAGGGADRLRTLGMATPRSLAAVRGFAGAVEKRRAVDFWAAVKQRGAGVQRSARSGARVWLDGKRQILLDRSVPQIGGPTAWAAGFTGKGITVAVLDTGIDMAHPDFAGRIAATANFTTDADVQDRIGHGTHVSSIVAGSGAASGGLYRGVAPDAMLAVGKVCTDFGCQDSAILAGMQWAAETQHARVINMSLGGAGGASIDPLEEGIDNLSASTGALFVVAAGNTGCSSASTIQSPAIADAALSVGAVDRNGAMASFSSCGPRPGDGAIKPEITAPGVDIVAARSSTGQYPPVDATGYYTQLSGTSMATPHVAGSAALVAQQHLDWKGADIKALLVATAAPSNASTVYLQGAGLVNVGSAVQRTWFGDTSNVSFGVQAWPHGDDPLLTKRITLRNGGTQAVTLNLSTSAMSTTGTVAPPGMFYLSATQVNLASGASTTVDLMANTSVNVADGIYGGEVVATDGQGKAAILFSVVKEVESYDLALTHIDPNGQPAASYYTLIDRLDATQSTLLVPASAAADGKATVRLPKGRYRIVSSYDTGARADVLAQPSLTLDRTKAVTIDARRAALWQFKLPAPTAVATVRFFDITNWHLPDGFSTVTGASFDPSKLYYVGRIEAGSAAAVDDFSFSAGAEFAHLDANGSVDTSLPIFHLSESVPGKMPIGLRKAYRFQDLAKLTALLPRPPTDALAVYQVRPELARSTNFYTSFDVPNQRDTIVSYVNAGPDLRWSQALTWQSLVTFEQLPQTSAAAAYAPGSDSKIDWRSPLPYSPALNSTFDVFDVGATPDLVYNDPASKLAPGLRRGTGNGNDMLLLSLQPFGDVAGSAGTPLSGTPNLVTFGLSRDGTPLAQQDVTFYGSAVVTIPALAGNYTMTVDARQPTALGPLIGLPSRSTTVWTFASKPARADAWTALPLSVVRLGKLGRNPAGGLYFPVQVLRQATTAPVPDEVRSLSIELSADGGNSWRAAPLSGGGSEWSVSVPWSAFANRSLSVRAKAVSADGAVVQQTLLGVYSPTAMR